MSIKPPVPTLNLKGAPRRTSGSKNVPSAAVHSSQSLDAQDSSSSKFCSRRSMCRTRRVKQVAIDLKYCCPYHADTPPPLPRPHPIPQPSTDVMPSRRFGSRLCCGVPDPSSPVNATSVSLLCEIVSASGVPKDCQSPARFPAPGEEDLQHEGRAAADQVCLHGCPGC